MSKSNNRKYGGVLAVLAILIITIGTGAYIYFDTSLHSKVGLDSITVSEGLTKVGDAIVVSMGTSNMTLIESDGKGLLVDTGYKKEEAQRISDYMDNHNITLEGIIITHMHNDHTANLGMFTNDNVKIYKPADFEDGQELSIGSKKLKMLKTDGHTPKNTHISVEITKDNVLIAGDVVLTDGLPAVGGSYRDLTATLERIDSKEYSVIIPGHGAIVESRAAVSKNLEYLKNAGKSIEELISSGGTLPQIEGISIESCVSDISSENNEILLQVHRFNLTNIYQQLKREMGK